MDKMNRLFVAALLMANAATIFADIPFREHRYDSFRATPVGRESIVFYGNSITNMNEWWECFGDNHNIVNRGNSGGLSVELLKNAGCITSGQPSKVFIGIGTNDLETKGLDSADQVAANIRDIISRFKTESPRTEVYVQSILPSELGRRTEEKIKEANDSIRKVCKENGVVYIDLFDDMKGIVSQDISYDGLHLTARGYKIWCDKIAPYVGSKCTMPEKFVENSSGMLGFRGMAATYWSAEKVKEDDVLMIGDEMIRGGEWHELLNSSNVKNRGMGWGSGGMDMRMWVGATTTILSSNPKLKTAPSAICLYIGVNEVNSDTSLESAIKRYEDVIENIRIYAPEDKTRILVMSLLPKREGSDKEGRIAAFNELVKKMSSRFENVEFVDITTPCTKDGVADENLITEKNYLNARGYNKVAHILADMLGSGFKVMSEQEFEKNYKAILDKDEKYKSL